MRGLRTGGVVVGYEAGLGGQSSYEYLMSPHLTRPQGLNKREWKKINLNLFVFRPVQSSFLSSPFHLWISNVSPPYQTPRTQWEGVNKDTVNLNLFVFCPVQRFVQSSFLSSPVMNISYLPTLPDPKEREWKMIQLDLFAFRLRDGCSSISLFGEISWTTCDYTSVEALVGMVHLPGAGGRP